MAWAWYFQRTYLSIDLCDGAQIIWKIQIWYDIVDVWSLHYGWMDAFNAYGWPAKVVSDTKERKRSGTLFGKAMDHQHHNFLPMIPKLGDPGVPESPEENDHLILCHTHGLGPSYIVPKCPQNFCFLGHSREKKPSKRWYHRLTPIWGYSQKKQSIKASWYLITLVGGFNPFEKY